MLRVPSATILQEQFCRKANQKTQKLSPKSEKVENLTGVSSPLKYEPAHDKTNKMACALSEDSAQPGHLPSLIRVFTVGSMVAKDPSFLHEDSENSDQTGWMPRQI